MKKIPTIFERDWNGDRSLVINKPNPICQWVFDGEGIATRKYDGTCCMVREGKLYKRRELRKGDSVPAYFEQIDRDEETGKTFGWVPVGYGPEDKYHRAVSLWGLGDGTYELLGPKIQGNVEGRTGPTLQMHGMAKTYPLAPRTFYELKFWLTGCSIEGLVWHHEDGRMAKIKLQDFGLKRSTKSVTE